MRCCRLSFGTRLCFVLVVVIVVLVVGCGGGQDGPWLSMIVIIMIIRGGELPTIFTPIMTHNTHCHELFNILHFEINFINLIKELGRLRTNSNNVIHNGI